MEFPRDENDQIHSQFAFRIGKIVEQYEGLQLPEDGKFEVTLYIIALQSLLTQLQEKHDAIRDVAKKSKLDQPVPASSDLWGINNKLIQKNTFEENPLTYFKLLTHIRHALSHPTKQLQDNSTGYTTTGNDPSKRIEGFRFVHAPNPNNNFCIEIDVKTIRELVLGLSDFLNKPDF